MQLIISNYICTFNKITVLIEVNVRNQTIESFVHYEIRIVGPKGDYIQTILSDVLPTRGGSSVDEIRIHQLGVVNGVFQLLHANLANHFTEFQNDETAFVMNTIAHRARGVLWQAQSEEASPGDGQIVVRVLLRVRRW